MKKKMVWPLLFILVLAFSRWPVLMPPNFSAVYAIVFCAGLYLPGVLGWIIPLGVVAVSDVLLSVFFYAHGHFSLGDFLAGQAPNYLVYAGLIALGRMFGAKRPWWLLLAGGVIGALLFYIVTNTGAWFTLPYPKTFSGWIQAVTVGFPGYPQTWEFFRNTALSGGLFTGLFVGAMKLTEAQDAREAADDEEKSSDESEPVKAES